MIHQKNIFSLVIMINSSYIILPFKGKGRFPQKKKREGTVPSKKKGEGTIIQQVNMFSFYINSEHCCQEYTQ